ncbi:efflux RND transporter periplasmic adaptor subunit [Reichenbachiella ulvae]|uniref:Efflux RND transporter periplasmic adaptor subunit n=1 Tax=Reichenbachiella ulvae TaxID=2980104 RepID=A0ABT3CPM4_9BACT|nr:efflux RND transporter periplasmic adaptor subunit [Reichenbachiella ulvae]MCV9385562.1 efflux RND transporter periplasmic adaptor subunit [Reichenbachiella ulvae]
MTIIEIRNARKASLYQLLVLLSLSTLIFGSGCEHKAEHHELESKYAVTSPIKRDTLTTREYVCQIHSSQHIDLRALERGYLEKIYVDEGQFVKKGQLMFQIMPRLYQAELEKAEAEAHYAEIEYRNTKKLAENNVVSPNELALAEANLDKAKAELSLAAVHLDFTKVRAPFDGIMDHLHVRLGSLVDEGELLTTLSDNHEMWVYFNVPEAEYLDYKIKVSEDSALRVKLMMANNKLFSHEGEVNTIEADFNNETGNIAFRATFPNPKGLLRHGETGNILVEAPLKDALLIPQKATFEILDKKYVFVLGDDHVLHSKQIVVGAELPHLYEVKAGLTENDKILLEGLRKVKDGDKIGVDFIDPVKVLSELELYSE